MLYFSYFRNEKQCIVWVGLDRYGFIIMAFLKWFYFAGIHGIDPTIYQFILLIITLGTSGKSLGIKGNKTNAYIVWLIIVRLG